MRKINYMKYKILFGLIFALGGVTIILGKLQFAHLTEFESFAAGWQYWLLGLLFMMIGCAPYYIENISFSVQKED